jgi:hypothetical protein
VTSQGEEVFFKIKKTTKLVKLQGAYANKVGKDVNTIRFVPFFHIPISLCLDVSPFSRSPWNDVDLVPPKYYNRYTSIVPADQGSCMMVTESTKQILQIH